MAMTEPPTHRSPKVSVITPSYNQAAFIKQMLLSMLNQNYPNLQHIVIDSMDNSFPKLFGTVEPQKVWAMMERG